MDSIASVHLGRVAISMSIGSVSMSVGAVGVSIGSIGATVDMSIGSVHVSIGSAVSNAIGVTIGSSILMTVGVTIGSVDAVSIARSMSVGSVDLPISRSSISEDNAALLVVLAGRPIRIVTSSTVSSEKSFEGVIIRAMADGPLLIGLAVRSENVGRHVVLDFPRSGGWSAVRGGENLIGFSTGWLRDSPIHGCEGRSRLGQSRYRATHFMLDKPVRRVFEGWR